MLTVHIIEEWFPLKGEQTHSFKKNFFFNLNLKLQPHKIHFLARFSSTVSKANLSSVVATISLVLLFFIGLHGELETFGNCIILQSFSSFFDSLSFLSNSF